jgi:glycosyltransferase involved in cell wall biosynthesis
VNSSPLVSVLIPAHRAGRWVGAAIRSALAQTHPAVEVVVVDDGSPDDTRERAEEVAARHPDRVTVLSVANRGASAARNLAFARSRGRYIQYLDADDVLDPGKVAAQVAVLEAGPPLGLASGRWRRFAAVPGDRPETVEASYRDLSGVEFLQLFYEQTAMMQPGAWLTPRGLVEQAGPWDETLSVNDDGEFFARVVLASDGIRFCPDAVVHYRSDHGPTLSRQRGARALESVFRATELITGRLLAADRSPRSVAAAAYAWKWTAFELLPEEPARAEEALRRCAALGGSPRPYPAGPRLRALASVLGWRRAKQLAAWLARRRSPSP